MQIRKKECFQRLDGAFQLTGKILNEWHVFDSLAEAQQIRGEALKDDNVLSASIETDEFRTR